jgi:hypothetical protein
MTKLLQNITKQRKETKYEFKEKQGTGNKGSRV